MLRDCEFTAEQTIAITYEVIRCFAHNQIKTGVDNPDDEWIIEYFTNPSLRPNLAEAIETYRKLRPIIGIELTRTGPNSSPSAILRAVVDCPWEPSEKVAVDYPVDLNPIQTNPKNLL